MKKAILFTLFYLLLFGITFFVLSDYILFIISYPLSKYGISFNIHTITGGIIINFIVSLAFSFMILNSFIIYKIIDHLGKDTSLISKNELRSWFILNISLFLLCIISSYIFSFYSIRHINSIIINNNINLSISALDFISTIFLNGFISGVLLEALLIFILILKIKNKM